MAARRTYDAELNDLARAYRGVLDWDGVDSLQRALMAVAGGPAVFIGTGGTLAVARFAAQLHEYVGGQPARAATPLELASLPPMTRAGAVLFSAGLKHPDALAVLARLGSGRLRPAVVVTMRDPDELCAILPADVEAIALPATGFREGFLATTSVLVMATALVRAYSSGLELPGKLSVIEQPIPERRSRLLVLTTPGLAAAAVDLETRFHELGLASVQVTDYRNFAHGRHVGLARHASETSVIGLVDQPLRSLATATLQTIPQSEIAVCAWEPEAAGPVGVIELLVASMRYTALVASEAGVNVSRPGAPTFGRRLYHLGLRRLLPKVNDGPVDRKLLALVAASSTGEARHRYEQAHADWLKAMSTAEFGGVVLDYDGTVCATRNRTKPPDPAIQAEILRLLGAGVRLGFASGRGGSLHRQLRAWIPKRHWKSVRVGLYNGGSTIDLGESLPDLSTPSNLMLEVVERLVTLPIADALTVEGRATQVTITVRPGAYAQFGRLSALISDTVSRDLALPVKVRSSDHSVDVVPSSTTKCRVTENLEAITGRDVLSIGDQGDVGGNDFELLSRSPWSLTVDRCSADPSRCWYLGDAGRAGPDVLLDYLRTLQVVEGAPAVVWSRS